MFVSKTKIRCFALFAIALLVACGGSGPDADEGKLKGAAVYSGVLARKKLPTGG